MAVENGDMTAYIVAFYKGFDTLKVEKFIVYTTGKQVKTDRTKPTAAYKTDRRSRGRF